MLSGGQKQRIAIAGMLAMEPEVLVLDEATAMLDPQGRREVLDIVGRLNRERGMTVVMITQPGDSYGRRKAYNPGYAERGIQQGEGTPGQRP